MVKLFLFNSPLELRLDIEELPQSLKQQLESQVRSSPDLQWPYPPTASSDIQDSASENWGRQFKRFSLFAKRVQQWRHWHS